MLQLTEVRGAEDLSPDIDVLNGTDADMQRFTFVNALKGNLTAKSYKHEWQDDSLQAESISLEASTGSTNWDTATQTAAMPVADAVADQLKIGDLILLATGSEIVRITDVDTSGNTIDVVRGVGGTASAQGGTAFTAYKIGNAQEDGSDPSSPAMTTPTERYNYTQIFENPYDVSTALNRLKISNTKEFLRQRALATKHLISQLDYNLYYGVRYSSGKVFAMNGLRNVATTTYNINGTLTIEKLYLALKAMFDAGGHPDQVHCATDAYAWLEQVLDAGYERVPMKHHAQFSVKTIDIFGIKLEMYHAKHIHTSGEMMFVDSSRVAFGPLQNGGSFAPYEVDRNGKQLKDHIVGMYTCEVRNPAAALCRAYGATGV